METCKSQSVLFSLPADRGEVSGGHHQCRRVLHPFIVQQTEKFCSLAMISLDGGCRCRLACWPDREMKRTGDSGGHLRSRGRFEHLRLHTDSLDKDVLVEQPVDVFVGLLFSRAFN